MCHIAPTNKCKKAMLVPLYRYNVESGECELRNLATCHRSGFNGFRTKEGCMQTCSSTFFFHFKYTLSIFVITWVMLFFMQDCPFSYRSELLEVLCLEFPIWTKYPPTKQPPMTCSICYILTKIKLLIYPSATFFNIAYVKC